jgi:hypothetical protein
MTREFIMTEFFDLYWNKLKLTDDDLKDFQNFLLENPERGDIIKGTGGARKVRWKLSNKGKSGGIRCIYIDFDIYKTIYLLIVYPKSTKDNLTEKEKQNLKKLVKELADSMKVVDE